MQQQDKYKSYTSFAKKEDEATECTFRPKISRRSIELSGGSRGMSGKAIYSKNIDWMDQKDKLLQSIRDATKDKDLEGCTFVPQKEVLLYSISSSSIN